MELYMNRILKIFTISFLLLVSVNFDILCQNTDKQRSSDYYEQGIIYAKQRNYDKAIEYFGKAMAINPGWATSYNYRGYLLNELGVATLGRR